MTRWDRNDFGGWVVEQAKTSKDKWGIYILPAIAGEDDPLGRDPGTALWPERYPLEELEALRTTLGSYQFSALFQQNPREFEAGLFKRSYYRYFVERKEYYELSIPGRKQPKRVPKDKCWSLQTVDAAGTEKDRSDYSVVEHWIVTPDLDLLLYDLAREQIETTSHMGLMRSMFDRFSPRQQVVENKVYGTNIVQEGKREGLPIVGIQAEGDKFVRSLPLQARYEAGTVYHRKGASYLAAYEEELIDFPDGKHDDQVDAAAYAAIRIGLLKRRRGKIRILGEPMQNAPICQC